MTSVYLIQPGLDYDVHLEKSNCCTQPQEVSVKMITLLSSKYISMFENYMECYSRFCKLLLPV